MAPLDHDADDEDDKGEQQEEQELSSTTVSSALSGALDRLAHFISPLFKEDVLERELRAVDSEYSNSLSSDSWRMYQ